MYRYCRSEYQIKKFKNSVNYFNHIRIYGQSNFIISSNNHQFDTQLKLLKNWLNQWDSNIIELVFKLTKKLQIRLRSAKIYELELIWLDDPLIKESEIFFQQIWAFATRFPQALLWCTKFFHFLRTYRGVIEGSEHWYLRCLGISPAHQRPFFAPFIFYFDLLWILVSSLASAWKISGCIVSKY